MQVQGMGTHCQVSSQFIKKDLQFFGRVPTSPREGLEPGSPDPESSALPVAPSEPLLEVVVLSIFIYVIDVVNKANLKVFKGRGTSERSRR